MTRLERAKIIHERVLSHPESDWSWLEAGAHRLKCLRTSDWMATIITPFSGIKFLSTPRAYREAVLLKHRAKLLPYVLDVALLTTGKVLSLEWDENQARLISMRRGSWEQEFFDLPEDDPV